jgi:hypothetical protein
MSKLLRGYSSLINHILTARISRYQWLNSNHALAADWI